MAHLFISLPRSEDMYACPWCVPIPVCSLRWYSRARPLPTTVCLQPGQSYQRGSGTRPVHHTTCLQDSTGIGNVSINRLRWSMTKPRKGPVWPVKIQTSLGICPVWSVFVPVGSRFESLVIIIELPHDKTNKMSVHPANHDKTNKMSVRPAKFQISLLIWVFAGHTVILLVLSWGGLYRKCTAKTDQMPRLSWSFAVAQVIMLVLSCSSSLTSNSRYVDFVYHDTIT